MSPQKKLKNVVFSYLPTCLPHSPAQVFSGETCAHVSPEKAWAGGIAQARTYTRAKVFRCEMNSMHK